MIRTAALVLAVAGSVVAAGPRLIRSGISAHPMAQPLVIRRTAGGAPPDTATFAGGCFWSMERPFQHVPGVLQTAVGYTGGTVDHPTYEQVSDKNTGHAESVQVIFDSSKVSYEKLLDVYWHNIDPLAKDFQFCDGGDEYRTAIFYHGQAQHDAAERSKVVVQKHFTKPVLTEITAAKTFWMAEEYHQHFADRNPERYDAYRRGCGRDARLKELWGDLGGPYVPKH